MILATLIIEYSSNSSFILHLRSDLIQRNFLFYSFQRINSYLTASMRLNEVWEDYRARFLPAEGLNKEANGIYEILLKVNRKSLGMYHASWCHLIDITRHLTAIGMYPEDLEPGAGVNSWISPFFISASSSSSSFTLFRSLSYNSVL